MDRSALKILLKNQVGNAFFFFLLILIAACDQHRDREKKPIVEEGTSGINTQQEVAVEDHVKRPVKDEFGFPADSLELVTGRIQRGESFYDLMRPYMDPKKIISTARQSRKRFDVRKLSYGDRYRLYLNSENQEKKLAGWVLLQDQVNYVVMDFRDSLRVNKGRKQIDTTRHTTAGVINVSLYESIRKQELSPILVNKLSEVYAWEIDFFALQPGDQFRMIYEQLYIDGNPYAYGDIVAAEFVHEGDTTKAYLFQKDDRSGYYNERGESLQKELLKAPLQYSRISSGYSYSRLHPILKKRMPHLGIDYAAPRGTPVVSVGDGTVIEARYRGANGKIAKIRHNSSYTTAYLHLNGFARGIRRGVEVEQGQVIGYVGSTGRSTGPHLDYRIYKHGSPVNPLSIDPPSTDNIPDSLLPDYQKYIAPLKQKLKQVEQGGEKHVS